MKKLWTFENKDKRDAFLGTLGNHSIPFQLFNNKMQPDAANGLNLYVEEEVYEDARRVFVYYRRKNTNRHRK